MIDCIDLALPLTRVNNTYQCRQQTLFESKAMVSRKKAKGKARKEAKVKANVEECAALKPFSSLQFNKSSCTHGWTHDEYAENHDCHKFVVAVFEEFRRTKTVSDTFHAANDATLEKYPEIWKDPTILEWIASAFVSIGVEVLVQ